MVSKRLGGTTFFCASLREVIGEWRRRKFDVLHGHCEAAGRPYDAVLRTALVSFFLFDSQVALEAKMAQVSRGLLGFFEQLPIVGAPEEAATRVRALVEAGFQYVAFIIMPFDRETLQLAAERVIPAVVGG